MKTAIRTAAFLIATMGFAPGAFAQGEATAARESQVAAAPDSLDGRGAASAGSWMEAGAFDGLSDQDQKIAETVFNNQSVTPSGSAPMSLDQIATVRRHGGWKAVVSWMRMDGLTAAKSLRDLLATAEKKRRQRAGQATTVKARMTVVTNGNGERIILYSRGLAEQPGTPKPLRKPGRKTAGGGAS